MSKEVIIYGGAFNPPTNAHKVIAQAAVQRAAVRDAEFWIMPSGERADKPISIPFETRIALAKGLLKSLADDYGVKVHVYDYELQQPTSRTIDTVGHLSRAHPDTKFTWLFGSDSVQDMPMWRDGDWLTNNLDMLVVEREGYEVDMLENMELLQVETPIVSSTEVRQRLMADEMIDDLVPFLVAEILSIHRREYTEGSAV